MELTFADLLYTVFYSLNIVSFMFRSIFWLRLGVLISTIGFVVFALILGNVSMIVCNGIFVVVNAYQLFRLILENLNIDLGEELEEIYEKVFHRLNKKDFLFLWEIGNEVQAENGCLIRQGEEVSSMYYLIEGSLEILKDGRSITLVTPNHFVGEMSFLTGDNASSDVISAGKVRVHEWNQEKIRCLEKIKPDLLNSMAQILSQDLSRKLKKWD